MKSQANTKTKTSIVDRLFRDSNGKIVIGQFPNPPLIGWIVCILISNFLSSYPYSEGVQLLGTSFGFIWSYLEMTQGVNLFRKILGTVILTALVIGLFI